MDEPSPDPSPIELTVDQQRIVDDLNRYSHPLSDANPIGDPAELSPLDRLRDVRIVGLGEATHGTREFFRMKHRIFRYLVENHGYNVFAFEMDFAEGMIFNEYVLTGQGNIDQLMKEKMIFWTWRTEEVKDLLLWMKSYNESRADESKIQFWGYDTQFNTYNAPFLLKRLNNIDADLHRQATLLLQPFQQLDPDYYSEKTEAFRNGIKRDVDSLYNLIEANQALIEESTSENDYRLILQLARSIVQTEQVRWSFGITTAPNHRDQYMAENQIWLLDYLGAGTKIASWAHNEHVANNINFGIGGGMGFHLRNELGRNYQVLGFSFSKGRFTAFNRIRLGANNIEQEPLEDSFNFFFHYAEEDNFILDLHDIPNRTSLINMINTPNKFLSIGSVYYGNPNEHYGQIRLKSLYDIIIHFDETENSKLL